MQRILCCIIIFITHNLYAQHSDTLILSRYTKYEGEWPKGKGILYDDYSGLYIGDFVHGKPHGNCLHFTPQERYSGGFVHGKRHGEGLLFEKDGNILSGGFVGGVPSGAITYFYGCDSLFFGVYIDGVRKSGNTYIAPKEKIRAMLPEFPDFTLSEGQNAYLARLEEIIAATSSPPKFKKGDLNDFCKWLNSRLRFPPEVKDRLVSEGIVGGRVIIRITIGEEGKIEDTSVLRKSPSPEFDRHVLKLIHTSPPFEPKIYWGKPVKSTFVFPVIFRFQ